MAHKITIVDVQKIPNLAAPQGGLEHTIVYYQRDGSAAATYSVTIAGAPITAKQAEDACNTDSNQRDAVVGQSFTTH